VERAVGLYYETNGSIEDRSPPTLPLPVRLRSANSSMSTSSSLSARSSRSSCHSTLSPTSSRNSDSTSGHRDDPYASDNSDEEEEEEKDESTESDGESPEIDEQPPKFVVVANKRSTKIKIDASGTEPLRYTWKRMPEERWFCEGNALVLNGNPTESGTYVCVVKNKFGNATSDPVRVGVTGTRKEVTLLGSKDPVTCHDIAYAYARACMDERRLMEKFAITQLQARTVLQEYRTVEKAELALEKDYDAALENATDVDFDPVPATKSTVFECPVCWDDVSMSESFALECGHRFCLSCVKKHLKEKITADTTMVKCLHNKCPYVLSNFEIFRVAPIDVAQRFRKWIAKSYVERNTYRPETNAGFIFNCPAPGCEQWIDLSAEGKNNISADEGATKSSESCPSVTTVVRFDVPCACGAVTCMECSAEAHSPARCNQVERWKEMGGEDAIEKRLLVKCKKCPFCGQYCYIPDKVACDHITCACGREWCWLCYGDWRNHTSCNRMKANQIEAERARLKAEVEKSLGGSMDSKRAMYYEHVCERYASHQRALLKAKKYLRKQVDAILKGIARSGMFGYPNDDDSAASKSSSFVPIDLDLFDRSTAFLKECVTLVLECRRIMKWSYVFLFFLPEKTTVKSLFEVQQGMLEDNVRQIHEDLSKGGENDEKHAKSSVVMKFLRKAAEGNIQEARGDFFQWKNLTIQRMKSISDFARKFCFAARTNTMLAANPAEARRLILQRKRQEAHYREIGDTGWSCPACTFRNRLSSAQCEVCGTDKLGTRKGP